MRMARQLAQPTDNKISNTHRDLELLRTGSVWRAGKRNKRCHVSRRGLPSKRGRRELSDVCVSCAHGAVRGRAVAFGGVVFGGVVFGGVVFNGVVWRAEGEWHGVR